MTTIAWDGARLAADTLNTVGNQSMRASKIMRTPDGRLLGASGHAVECAIVMEWIAQLPPNRPVEPPIPWGDKDWPDVLEIDPDGGVWRWGDRGRFKLHDTQAALGSGAPYALAAMYLGDCAQNAVEIACVFDPNTGSPIEVLELGLSQKREESK